MKMIRFAYKYCETRLNIILIMRHKCSQLASGPIKIRTNRIISKLAEVRSELAEVKSKLVEVKSELAKVRSKLA